MDPIDYPRKIRLFYEKAINQKNLELFEGKIVDKTTSHMGGFICGLKILLNSTPSLKKRYERVKLIDSIGIRAGGPPIKIPELFLSIGEQVLVQVDKSAGRPGYNGRLEALANISTGRVYEQK
jgi:hypothetical protein